MKEFELDTKRDVAAWEIYMALIAAGATASSSYGILAESAFVAVDRFLQVQEEQNKDGV